MKKLLVIVVSLLLMGCAYQIKANDFGAKNLEKAISGMVIVKSESLVKGRINKGKKIAIGIPLENGLVIALKHAVVPRPEVRVRTPFGWFSKPITILKTEYFIGKEKVELIGIKDDIALFRSKTTKKFPYEFGNSETLRVGDRVAIVGYPYLQAICVKVGIVSNPRFISKFRFAPNLKAPVFLLNFSSSPGDSGGAVISYQNGTLKLIAVQCGVLGNDGVGVAYRGNYIQDCIAEILRGKNAS